MLSLSYFKSNFNDDYNTMKSSSIMGVKSYWQHVHWNHFIIFTFEGLFVLLFFIHDKRSIRFETKHVHSFSSHPTITIKDNSHRVIMLYTENRYFGPYCPYQPGWYSGLVTCLHLDHISLNSSYPYAIIIVGIGIASSRSSFQMLTTQSDK